MKMPWGSPVTTLLPTLSSLVFAYGATGAGKTHTMLGRERDPGIMYLTTMELYRRLEACREEKRFEVLISYLEVWLLAPQDGQPHPSVSQPPEEGVGWSRQEGQRVVGSGRTGAQRADTARRETACELTLVVTLRHTLRHLARVIHQACLVIFSDPGTLPSPTPLGERLPDQPLHQAPPWLPFSSGIQ